MASTFKYTSNLGCRNSYANAYFHSRILQIKIRQWKYRKKYLGELYYYHILVSLLNVLYKMWRSDLRNSIIKTTQTRDKGRSEQTVPVENDKLKFVIPNHSSQKYFKTMQQLNLVFEAVNSHCSCFPKRQHMLRKTRDKKCSYSVVVFSIIFLAAIDPSIEYRGWKGTLLLLSSVL